VREKAFLEYDESGRLLGGFGITQDVTDRRAAEDALRESESERAKQLERSRLARDLHDSVSQAIFAASLKAEALNIVGECAAPEVAQTAAQVSRLCRGALAELRTMLLELHGERLEDLPMERLLRQLVDATEGRTSTQVALAIEGASTLPTAVHVAFYRVSQEALNNVARHAQATQAWVEASLCEAEATVAVRDNGRGFEQRDFGPGHLGLRSMRDRAAEIGADLKVTSAHDQGTCITLRWRRAEA
jgi:signal transduction histidine kinase